MVGALSGQGWTVATLLVLAGFGLGWWLARRWWREKLEAGSVNDARHMQSVLRNIDALLWEADVRLEGGEPSWTFRMQETRLTEQLFPRGWHERRLSLWRDLQVPEMAEMNRRSRDALERGLPGYQQEFRIPVPGGYRWIRETVVINVRGEGRFWLIGFAIDITDQRLAEQERRASERSLGEILRSANCLLWRSNVRRAPDGRLNWLHFDMPQSGLYPQLFGDRSATAGGKLWSLIDAPLLPEMNRRSTQAILSNAPGYEQMFPVHNHEGQMFWLHEQVSILQQAEGEWHLVGVITDITERRAAEQAVRLSEARYRSLFEHMPVSIVESDFTAVGEWLDQLRAEGVTDLRAYLREHPAEVSRGAMRVHVLSANEAARSTIGARDTREIRWRRQLLETESSGQGVTECFLALWEGRNFIEREVELKRLDGEALLTTMRWWVPQTEHGLDLSQSIMIFVDVTELKRVQADLAAQREQLVVTLRSMKEGVIATDIMGRVRFINPAAQELIGKSEAAAIGEPLLRACGFVSAKSGEGISVPLEQVAAGDVVLDLPDDTALQRDREEPRLIEGQLAPVHDSSSKVTGVVLVFRDITDRDRLEKEMVRATRLESVGVLAGGIAHDFNNILTTVIGNLSIAQLDVTADSGLGKVVREAERAALKAKDLTQQLLTFAKGGEPIREAVHLEEVIREMTGFALHGSNVRAEFNLADDLWLADVDKGQIGRVVQNLVINAAQAMPEGGRVHISATNEALDRGLRRKLRPGRYVRIQIKDTGVGIKPDHLGRIFDPYFSTKQAGSGLGLSAAYSIVNKHQGVLDVESELGVGTTFSIWLPVAIGARREDGESEDNSEEPLRGRVLFMDDEESIREMIVNLLGRLGLEVEVTADGEALVAAYRREFERGMPPDLVLTDLTVPGGMGGKAAMEALLRIDPQVRAVVSSGYSSDPIMANYRDYGFCGMVAKPYKLPELRRVLRKALALE